MKKIMLVFGTRPEAIKEFIPNFEHEEKGKNLDQKMWFDKFTINIDRLLRRAQHKGSRIGEQACAAGIKKTRRTPPAGG